MVDTHYITSVVDNSAVTALLPIDQPKLHVINNGKERDIFLQETIGNILFPSLVDTSYKEQEKHLGTAGLIVVPIEGGGRGPIINHGETITLSLLFDLLSGALTKDQLGPELLDYLDRVPFTLPNTRSQSGYASHNDVITLDHDWTGYPPTIELSLAQGPIVNIIHTQIGVDPDCITYVEIPQQDIIFGHSGIINNNTFTVKAAITEKEDPIDISVNWIPNAIVGPPNALTTESVLYETTTSCIGLRIQGIIGLTNNLTYAVSGVMYGQMSIDGSAWINIATLHWNFKESESSIIEEKFDVIMAYDQQVHSYKFRGYLEVESSNEINRELTGHIQVDTVTESGTGTVLSNDLLLKWSSKETL